MNPESRKSDGSDVVATLIRAGGRREAPPESAYRAVLAAAESALQEKLSRRRWRRLGVALAAAAALSLISVALYQRTQPPVSPPVPVLVAGVDRLDGLVEARGSAAEAWRPLDSSQKLPRGSLVRTGRNSGAGLVLQRHLSLRVAADTEIELTDAALVRLLRGAVYVDAAPDGKYRLFVATPLGTARHEGTQFELRYEPPRLRLRVREGRVYLDRESGSVQAAPGESVLITSAGEVERSRIPTHDAAWQWTQSLAPMPDFDERPARDLLQWFARQTGRQLHYTGPAAEQRAASAILHGRFSQMAPDEALEITLATTDLSVDLQDEDRILVGTR